MESPNKYLLPSKHFLIRGGIATVLLLLILMVQTAWFRALFHKKPLAAVVKSEPTTIGALVGKDSNGNGISDWEEKLWGLDPSALYTNGVANKEIIEQKRKELGASNSSTTPQNETDALARQLFTITTALSQSDQTTTESLTTIGKDLADQTTAKKVTNHYMIADVHTVKTSTTSLMDYYNTMATIASTYADEAPDIAPIITALETGDTSQISSLSKSAATYITFSKQLQKVSVPIGVASYHLDLMNGFYGMAKSFDYLIQLEDNGVYATTGIGIYKEYAQKVDQALADLSDYFTEYGILQ